MERCQSLFLTALNFFWIQLASRTIIEKIIINRARSISQIVVLVLYFTGQIFCHVQSIDCLIYPKSDIRNCMECVQEIYLQLSNHEP